MVSILRPLGYGPPTRRTAARVAALTQSSNDRIASPQTQAFPWMTYQHNRPGPSALYVHKLGSATWHWRYADALIAVRSEVSILRPLGYGPLSALLRSPRGRMIESLLRSTTPPTSRLPTPSSPLILSACH